MPANMFIRLLFYAYLPAFLLFPFQYALIETAQAMCRSLLSISIHHFHRTPAEEMMSYLVRKSNLLENACHCESEKYEDDSKEGDILNGGLKLAIMAHVLFESALALQLAGYVLDVL